MLNMFDWMKEEAQEEVTHGIANKDRTEIARGIARRIRMEHGRYDTRDLAEYRDYCAVERMFTRLEGNA